MNSRFGIKQARPSLGHRYQAVAGWGAAVPTATGRGGATLSYGQATSATHPLHDNAHNARLLDREQTITRAFAVIEPTMQDLAATSPDRLQSTAADRLGVQLPTQWLTSTWSKPIDMRRLYAYSVFEAFRTLADKNFDRGLSEWADGENAPELIRKWGFHAIDISPCADGRLSGVVDYILRVPSSMVSSRKSFAGGMFDVEESVRNWSETELGRHRESVPNAADEPTRYLKIGVYHTSSSNPNHEGCAAHGSDERVAAGALLDRLNAFQTAIENTYCCGATVATLLIGVDTDSDAIKVHVPDAKGVLSLDRYVDNGEMYKATCSLSRDEAKNALRTAVAAAAGVAADDGASEGMRWFAAYVLKNNLAQIEYVNRHHGGCYPDLGHTERFITVGDSFDDVQMRNLAYQAQMETVEEGAADLDVGIKIFKGLNIKRGLPVPVFVHFRYQGGVPGSRQRAIDRALRMERAIRQRFADLVRDKWLYTFVSIKDKAPNGHIETVEGMEFTSGDKCACHCKAKGEGQ